MASCAGLVSRLPLWLLRPRRHYPVDPRIRDYLSQMFGDMRVNKCEYAAPRGLRPEEIGIERQPPRRLGLHVFPHRGETLGKRRNRLFLIDRLRFAIF